MAGLDGLHPVFADRLQRMCHELGLSVTSGYRSSERQRQLYECWKAGTPGCSPANPAGTSNHEAVPNGPAAGLAADIGPAGSLEAAHSAGHRYGVHFPIENEPWHCQPVEVQSAQFIGIPSFDGSAEGYPGHPLGPGATGHAVRRIQAALNIPADGVFGQQTGDAVRAFQASHGLEVDGIVGPRTWAVLTP